MKVAFIGLQHWHVPFYLEALENIDQPVAAIADVDGDYVQRTAELVDAAEYTDYEKMVDEVDPDLIFAHAPHDEMTDLAGWLVDHDLPFHMEKPMGISWKKLAEVAREANEKDLWNGVALVNRQYGLIQHLHELGDDMGDVGRYYYGLFAGPPSRYPDLHCEWMLDPDRAGAGPLWNYGAHVVDLFLHLGKSPVVEVKAHWTHSIHGLDIEDLCCIQMINADGAVGVAEVSYTTPEGYEHYFSLSTDRLQVCTEKVGEGLIKRFDGENEEIIGHESNVDFRADVVLSFEQGKKPVADINDMVETLRVMEAARESARTGQVVKLDEEWSL